MNDRSGNGGSEKGVATEEPRGFSRRAFLKGLGLTAGAASLPLALAGQKEAEAADVAAEQAAAGIGPGAVKFSLKVNGQAKDVTVDPRTTLAEALRDHLDMTGTKVVCDRGACGGCTVHVNGESINSCMMLAVDARGKEITTVEGLVKDGKMDIVQEQFVNHDAQQCGFCTPGFVMRTRAFLNENPKPTLDQVKAGLAGNICRCGTYRNIFDAVMAAAGGTTGGAA